jgi:hypothetical protein
MSHQRNRMPRVRTLKRVEADIARNKRAQRRVRMDWDLVNRKLIKDGALVEAEGGPTSMGGVKVSPLVRQLKELDTARKILAAELKALGAEKAALEAQAAEATSDYAL